MATAFRMLFPHTQTNTRQTRYHNAQVGQCSPMSEPILSAVIETKVLELECTDVHLSKVLILVSQPWCQDLSLGLAYACLRFTLLQNNQ